MRAVSSTDYKYIGTIVPNDTKPGDIILLGDYEFQVQYVHNLENGNKNVGNFNYQLECEE